MAICRACHTGSPSLIASRTIAFTPPSFIRSPGWRSSAQKQQKRLLWSLITGSSASKLWAAEPSLIMRYIPAAKRSSASSTVTHSWSESTPAAAYPISSLPLSIGAWPSTKWWGPIIFSLSQTVLDSLSTPGTSISSPNPRTRLSFRKGLNSLELRTAPASSSGVAGTQDGNINFICKGRSSEVSSMYWIPVSPPTLAISWGSATTVVVPIGTTAWANPKGVSIELSIWTWESIKPGVMYFPWRSISFSPSYWPRPAIYPSCTAISVFINLPVKPANTWAFFSTSWVFTFPAPTCISLFLSMFISCK